MAKVIGLKAMVDMKGFNGTLIGSTVRIAEKETGLTKGTIVSEANFRSFTCNSGTNAGKVYGCLECKVELISGNTVKAQLSENDDFEIGDIVTVDIVESDKKDSNNVKYQNAIIKGIDKDGIKKPVEAKK